MANHEEAYPAYSVAAGGSIDLRCACVFGVAILDACKLVVELCSVSMSGKSSIYLRTLAGGLGPPYAHRSKADAVVRSLLAHRERLLPLGGNVASKLLYTWPWSFRDDHKPEGLATSTARILGQGSNGRRGEQRRANAAYAKAEQQKMGKAASQVPKSEKKEKPPISRAWLCEYSWATMVTEARV